MKKVILTVATVLTIGLIGHSQCDVKVSTNEYTQERKIKTGFLKFRNVTVSIEKVDSIYYDFSQKTYRIRWSALAAQSNLGFEYRTEKQGCYYIGASFHRPFGRIAGTQAVVESTSGSDRLWLSLSGSYFSVDLKYFLYDKYKTKKAVTE